MKYIIIFLTYFFSSNLYCQSFDTENENIDSNVYVFALKKYIEKNEVKDSLVIEFSESIEPRNLANEISKIKIVHLDYNTKLIKKGVSIVKIFPLILSNGQFSVSIVNFSVSKLTKKVIHFTNMLTSFKIIFEYNILEKALKYKSCRTIGCLGFTEYTD